MRCALITLLLTMSIPAAAQQFVRGRVMDGEKPVGYATVVLLRDGEQTVGTTTAEDGRFELAADAGEYLLVVRHVAYAPFESPTEIGVGDIDAGELRLTPASIGEVVVTAQTVTRQADRFVVNVDNSPALAGRDGAELLEKAPGVWMSDSGISINGAGGTKVFIDGRELKGSAEEIASYLRSLTAADIARIEIVPLAGAEFTADARGGVILLTLQRKRNDGIDGNLQATTTLGSDLAGYSPAGRIGIRTGRWTLNASASGIFTPEATTRLGQKRDYKDTYVPFSGTTEMKSRTNYGRGHFAAIFDPNPRHTVGVEVEYTERSIHMPTTAHTEIGTTTSNSDYRQHAGRNTTNATANYIWRIDTLGSQLRLIADYTRHNADGNNRYNTTDTTPYLQRDSSYRSASRSTYDILTGDLALTYKLPHAMTLRTGLRYTRNGMDDDSRYEARHAGTWEPLPDYGYTQRYTEHIGAAYASLSMSMGRWDASAGLRGEYTSVGSQQLDRSYFGLFPSVSVNYAFNDLRTWMLSGQWSRNIERPSFPALNPARLQTSEYSWQSGNPELRPTYMHRLSLTLIWKYRYTLTLGGTLHRDLIREVARTDQTNGNVIYIRPENHYSENHWFAAVSLPIRITRWFNLTVNSVGVMQRIRLERTDSPATHGLMFSNITAAFTLPAGFYFEAVYRGHSRLYSGNSEVGARHTLSATIKKQLCNKRLTLFVTAANLTNTGVEYASETDNMRNELKGSSGWTDRSWKIGATWNFRSGQKFKARSVESASESERKRLSKSEAE